MKTMETKTLSQLKRRLKRKYRQQIIALDNFCFTQADYLEVEILLLQRQIKELSNR
jgi:hypothetical protein